MRPVYGFAAGCQTRRRSPAAMFSDKPFSRQPNALNNPARRGLPTFPLFNAKAREKAKTQRLGMLRSLEAEKRPFYERLLRLGDLRAFASKSEQAVF
jgi:hypothetical protein